MDARSAGMDDQALLRYSRHILLDEIGIEGQERLAASTALVVGLGGLGSAAALYLAAAGVGHLVLADHDRVDLTNLQRQIAHTTARVGQAKVDSAATAIAALNPLVTVRAVVARADADWLAQAAAAADVVLDCTDHFAIRHAINAACVAGGVPLASAAALRFDAQVALYDTRRAHSPCYACVFPASTQVPELACATSGVFAPLVGMAGTAQAADALLALLGQAQDLPGRLRLLDARRMAWSELRTRRDPACSVCARRPG